MNIQDLLPLPDHVIPMAAYEAEWSVTATSLPGALPRHSVMIEKAEHASDLLRVSRLPGFSDQELEYGLVSGGLGNGSARSPVVCACWDPQDGRDDILFTFGHDAARDEFIVSAARLGRYHQATTPASDWRGGCWKISGDQVYNSESIREPLGVDLVFTIEASSGGGHAREDGQKVQIIRLLDIPLESGDIVPFYAIRYKEPQQSDDQYRYYDFLYYDNNTQIFKSVFGTRAIQTTHIAGSPGGYQLFVFATFSVPRSFPRADYQPRFMLPHLAGAGPVFHGLMPFETPIFDSSSGSGCWGGGGP